MANRVAITNLNASTMDILNTIRANASAEYQSLVPSVTQAVDIPKVGEVLMGYPALANQFLTSLINRIALVRIKSATFNNAYAQFKKGYLEYGETVEEVFVGICKAREFNPDKSDEREFKRTIPDVRTAFHTMNWRVEYPITVTEQELNTAFLSLDGVQNLIANIVSAVYTSAEYDEFLLFKYLMIKAVAHGKMYPVAMGTTFNDNAVSFRSMSNKLTFMSNKYNANQVHTATPRAEQRIIMDSTYDAQFDVNVLAGAFNMDKATYLGSRMLIDDFTSFDNDRFDVIRAHSDGLEEVTADELALMSNVKAILIDNEWFQVYDNLAKMTEKYVANGLYWNYFYHTWKTISSSPFSNAIVFVAQANDPTPLATITCEVTAKDVSDAGTILTLTPDIDDESFVGGNVQFVQTSQACQNRVAVHKYGAYIFPANANAVKIGAKANGKYYESTSTIGTTASVGDTITLYVDGYIDDTLSALVVKDNTTASVTLTPSFASGTLTYTANVASTVTSVNLKPTATDDEATVTITMGEDEYESEEAITLETGANVIKVKVEGTETTTYQVTVTKAS